MSDANTAVHPVTLTNGAVAPSPIAMAPMVVFCATKDGVVGQGDLAYFSIRSKVAGLTITGASTVSASGRGGDHWISVEDDGKIPGLSALANTIQKNGNKAILQLHHGGREAHGTATNHGYTVAPSAAEFPWLSVQPRELTHEGILGIIDDFGQAARRAAEAGLDGVEVHGANHYLLQQFFSAFSNRRDDEWGGDLQRRMAFPLAVLREVKKVVAEYADDDFIVGYRLCPEERHGDVVGYPIEECLELVDAVAEISVDYLHSSLFTGYLDPGSVGDVPLNDRIHERLAGRAPLMVVSNIHTEEQVVEALKHAELVAIGRSALIEPEFADKLMSGRSDEIQHTIIGRLDSLAWPSGLKSQYSGAYASDLPPILGMNA